MNITINKTRIRPSITIGPNKEHIEKEYRWEHKTTHAKMIEHEVTKHIKVDLEEMLSIRYRIESDKPIDDSYEKPIWKQGSNFYKAAYAAVEIEDNYNKALFWIRKAIACFDHEGVWFIKDRYNQHSDIFLYTNIQKDYDWHIGATVVSRSFLGETETNWYIGCIKEEPDLTSTHIRIKQFNEHIKQKKVEREASIAKYANR